METWELRVTPTRLCSPARASSLVLHLEAGLPHWYLGQVTFPAGWGSHEEAWGTDGYLEMQVSLERGGVPKEGMGRK